MSVVSVMTARQKDIAVIVARMVIAAVFVFAAVPKLIAPRLFAEAIANYHLVPDSMSSIAASVMPVMELVIAVALLIGVKERGAAVASALMLLVFALAMTTTIARGINLDCGCFGAAAEAQVSWLTVARNVLLMVVSIFIAMRPHAPFKQA